MHFPLLLLLPFLNATPVDRPSLTFEVTFTAAVRPGPVSARVYVFLGPADGKGEPRKGPDWFHPRPFFAVEANHWEPGATLRIGPDAVGFPGPLDALEPGEYAAQAVLRLNPDTQTLGDGEGNAFGPIVRTRIDPEKGGTIALTIDRVVPPRPFEESARIKLVTLPSPLLSAFHGRPIRQRAAVIVPEGDPKVPRPTLYIIPGFTGDHRLARQYATDRKLAFGTKFLRVVLDPDGGTGHHVFADSATNGPRGRALVEEFIPYIEATFPARAEPRARLLNGHSSGGWSSLWLQVTYPDTFGGAWATSPDPTDFREFQQVDLYEPNANLFRARDGTRRPLAHRGKTPVLYFDDFSKMEDVIGDGGQLRAFECVFSPLGPDGRARRLWDRTTGAIDPEVARAWKAYDLRLILEWNWPTLGPKLAGKLHVVTGALDTFYLEGATRRLGETLAALGSDATVELVPGRDHTTVLDATLADRFERAMRAAVERGGEGTNRQGAKTPRKDKSRENRGEDRGEIPGKVAFP